MCYHKDMADTLKKFDAETSKEDLIAIFTTWFNESQSYHDEMLKSQKISEQYYLGNQTDKQFIPEHSSDTVENRIFEGVETLVPIATANAHQFLALPKRDEESSKTKAKKVQTVLEKKYETLEIQRKLEDITRHLLLYRFGVLKYCWDHEINDIAVKLVDPRLIMIPKLRVEPHSLPYVMEIQEYTEEEMEEFFPDYDLSLASLNKASPKSAQGDGHLHGRALWKVYEVWTEETLAWFCNNELIEAKDNPYWDWNGEEKDKYKIDKKGKLVKKKENVFRNHLENPEKPYIFFTTFQISDGPVGPVSLVEIAIPIQDAINVQKRQIIDNLRQMGNGQVLMDTDAMSKEESDNITNEPGLVLRGELLASQNKLKRVSGVAMPNAHFSNLQHSEATLDNLMGIHSATRGAAAAKTLGQDILSRQQDFTRIDLITRVLNRGIYRLANGLVQLMKMYYDETHTFKVLGIEGAIDFVSIGQNDIEDGLEINVKSGQTLPLDELQLQNQAVQLWQLNALDPVTLFERLKFPNPEKAAERLVLWKQGQLTMETQAKIAEVNASAQAKASLTSSAGGEEEGRGTETPMNVLQRATQGMGGTAPSLPQAPNMVR